MDINLSYQRYAEESQKTRLECLSFDSNLRYAVPGYFVTQKENYSIFWRDRPAPVFHFTHKKLIELPRAEFLLVSESEHHVISYAVGEDGAVHNIYVNINMPAQRNTEGWSWRDLELDLRVLPDARDSWSVELLDQEEFDNSSLPLEAKKIALTEIERVKSYINQGMFPFSIPSVPWLGLGSLIGKR